MCRRKFFLAGRFVPRFVWCFLSLDVFALVVHDELCDFPAALSLFKRGASFVGQTGTFASLLCPVAPLFPVPIFFSEWANSIRYVLFSLAICLPIRILVTCLRWHYSGFLLNRRLGKRLLALGLALGIGTQVLFGLPLLIMGKSMLSHQLWLNTPACLPPMFLSFGLLIMALTKEPNVNRTINNVAASTLAVYLILTDAAASRLIAGSMGSLGLTGMVYALFSLISLSVIFAFCITLDFVRQRLMSPFDSLTDRTAGWLVAIGHKVATTLYEKCLVLTRG